MTDYAFHAKLSKRYPPPVGTILDGFELRCKAGEILAILGPSGSGKTTLLGLLAGLTQPSSDDHGKVIFSIGDFAYAFQRAELVPWRDCEQNAYHETDVLGLERSTIGPRVERLLSSTGLSRYRSLLPSKLSVGMQQRLQLVRIGARKAKTLLLDEPLGAVDQPLRIRLAQEFRQILKEDGSAAVWVTHDSLEAITVSDRVLVVGGKPLRVISEHLVDHKQPEDPSHGPVTMVGQNNESALEAQAALLRKVLLSTYLEGDGAHKEDSLSIPTIRGMRAKWEWLAKAVPFLLALSFWQVLVLLNPPLKFFLSLPSEWVPLLYSEFVSGGLLRHMLVTLRETTLGLVIGMPLGVIAGFLVSQSPGISRSLRPYLVGSTAVPLFVLAPAFILWFGIGEQMKVAIAALSCFPFVAYLVHDAAVQSRGEYYKYLRNAGAKRTMLFLHLELPGTLEGILQSIRPAAVTALIGAFLGEFIAANEGLGYYIVFQASRYRVAEVMVGVFVLFMVAVTIDSLSRWLAGRRNEIVSRLKI